MKGTHMLNHQTIEGLHALKLPAMAAGLAEQDASAAHQALSFEERLGLLVDRELTEREDRRLQRYLKTAKLRINAVIEDIDFRRRRGLERPVVLSLAECAWVRAHHNIAVVGPTGVGKTFLACALANAAIRRGHTALYLRAPRMLDELAVARVDGRFQRLTASWARIDVLVIDDFALRPLSADQAADVLEVIEDRAGLRSTIITSQLPIAMWHEAMAEPTVADAVLDRVLAHLHRIELDGESMRRPESESKAGAGEDRRAKTGAKTAGRAARHDAGGEAPR
jgi:DNA replication protein DnaC